MAKVSVVYWSQTGNTEAMAEAIAEGARTAGAEVVLTPVSKVNKTDVLSSDVIALGCPSMGVETLEEMEFDPFFADIESSLSGRKVALFGSYGWGDGQWMRDWESRTTAAGAIIYQGEGFIVNETPGNAELAKAKEIGAGLASF
ncbi:flavodoxin [Parasphaerochaeta coccoides]|uniref:Flavodoxin n=1 Tax=Parasphaerochaeta coccoides (strain ATCC BAA-1237 / DSM 17374 / SPN1) TaxID=760011 RepID=F4GII3_PARC1|nr:flavodoxin [Parasphaerochaeta coccoides]AEC01691.1 flavodoxin [Parasphaerochaeta coccoides DSM 17374]